MFISDDSAITETSGYRLCAVNGDLALFHRWVEKTQVVLKPEAMYGKGKMERLREEYETTHILPQGFSLIKLKSTVAIVEFEDGIVAEIAPTSIRFLDSSRIFSEENAERYSY